MCAKLQWPWSGGSVSRFVVSFSQPVIWQLRGRVCVSQVIDINWLDIYLIFENFHEILKVFVYLLANLFENIFLTHAILLIYMLVRLQQFWYECMYMHVHM